MDSILNSLDLAQENTMLGKHEWSTDEKCPICNCTGKRADGVDSYCSVCNGDGYLHKPHPADKWILVSDREELLEKWVEYTKEPECYDAFIQPKEFPCLARFFTTQCADSFGKFVQYFYRENLPLSWSDPMMEGIGV